jgi:hypothetical protein
VLAYFCSFSALAFGSQKTKMKNENTYKLYTLLKTKQNINDDSAGQLVTDWSEILWKLGR